MTRAGLAALWSHWRRNPLQLFTLIIGLALATGLWSGVQAINAEARASYDAAAASLGEGRYDQLLPRAGARFDQEIYIALRRAGWQVAPVLEGQLSVPEGRVRLIGLDPLTAPAGLVPQDDTGTGSAGLAAFMRADTVFAHPGIADALRASVPNAVVAARRLAPGTALADIGAAQRLLDRPGQLSRLIVLPKQAVGLPPIDSVAPDLRRQPAGQGSDVGRLTDSFHLNLTAFGLLSFAVGIFIVHGAIGLAFEQRRGLVRSLRALGMPLRRLIALLALELVVIALVAGSLGVVLGYVVAATLLPDVAATLRGLYGASISGDLQLRPSWWLSGLAIALLGTALAASGALWRIARMPLLASAGARAWAMTAGRARRWQAAGAAVFLLAALALVWLAEGLILSFLCLGLLLIGAALALPAILDRVLALGTRGARSMRWEWFWADTRQQLPGLSLALMALLLAIAANVGVSTMVSSFRLTFTAFLDQRLAAELYVSPATPEESAEMQAFLAPQVEAVLPILSVDTTLAGLPASLYGARIGPTYTENWRFLQAGPEPWPRVARGEAVIVNEQLARRADLWPGDTLRVAEGLALPIAGVFGDYGNPVGQAIVGETLFRDLYPEVRSVRFGLRTGDPDAIRAALTERFGLSEGQIIDQAGIKRLSLQVFERTFTVTGALNVLTLAVAGFAMLMSLLTLANLRLPQLAPAWALGLTRAELGRLELLRAILLAALTLVLALPLGLALAWVLLALVNVEAFGWRLPMYLFPLDYLRLSGLALLAALLAAAWPARRLARTPPADLLKVFAHER
ncbi:ABC transporter permease [Roseovarius aestuariivivens]|uniref:ABC transporter permease n=1 Tax=Roseovarius aestuariivivens TaxID=1888910 RepID=UPI001081B9BB|nr:ABC transporter permease [Roseovarius aestuariivivens]